MKNRKKRTRKKGAMIIEFLVVLPVFMLTLWIVMQLMLYTLAVSTINQASMEGARIIAQNLRGYEGEFSDAKLNDAGISKEQLENLVLLKMENVTKFNNYVKLFHDGKGNMIRPEFKVGKNRTECSTFLKTGSGERAVCIWSDDTFGDSQGQIGVMSKAKFNVIGNFIPGAGGVMTLSGMGISHKDLTNRFNYYE